MKNLLICSFSLFLIAIACAPSSWAAGENWHRDIDKALAEATKENKLVFMDIYADWCGPCRMMDQQTFSDERVKKRLQDFVPIKVDADVNMTVAAKYGTGSLPTIVAIMPDGSPIATTPGFHGPEQFLAWLDKAESKVASFRALEDEWRANPNDLDVAMALGREYLMMGRPGDGLPVLSGVRAQAEGAPDATTRSQFRYLLGISLLSDDQFDEGVALFEGFAEEFPDDPRAETSKRLVAEGTFLSAVAKLEAEDYAGAQMRFEKLAEQDTYPDIQAEASRRLQSLELLGIEAPALSVDEWVNEGSTTLADLEGKVVLIDFFQIICPGCKRAKPQIEALQEKYGDDGFAVVGIAVAFEHESSQQPDQIRAYVEETGYDWPVAIDEGLNTTFSNFQAQGSPWTVLVDRSGKVRHAAFFNEEEIRTRVASLVKEAA